MKTRYIGRQTIKTTALISVIFLGLLFAAHPAYSQQRIGIGVSGSYVYPVGSLQNWFKGTVKAPQINFVFNANEQSFWRLTATSTRFDRPNKDKLFYKDLNLDLKLYGAGVDYFSYLSGRFGFVQAYWTFGVNLYRWEALRDKYEAKDQFVPQRRQQDWSFAGSAGFGAMFHLSDHLKLTTTIRYHLVVGELWPALALHLENVSGMQMVQMQTGLGFWF